MTLFSMVTLLTDATTIGDQTSFDIERRSPINRRWQKSWSAVDRGAPIPDFERRCLAGEAQVGFVEGTDRSDIFPVVRRTGGSERYAVT